MDESEVLDLLRDIEEIDRQEVDEEQKKSLADELIFSLTDAASAQKRWPADSSKGGQFEPKGEAGHVAKKDAEKQ